MKNPYKPKIGKIVAIKKLSENVKLFTIKGEKISFTPGQFVEIGVFGFGEAPFAICSSAKKESKNFQVCIRKVGELTSKLHSLKIGEEITYRGPFGNGFPEEKSRNLILIGGGLGIVPLRSVILSLKEVEKREIFVFYCVRREEDILFKEEKKMWEKKVKLFFVVQNPRKNFKGHRGLVTEVLDKIDLPKNPLVFMCGPPPMYRPVAEKLKSLGIEEKDIFVSLERRMHCGIGTCQHCAIGELYVCKDGPVFNFAEIKNIPGAI